MNRKEIINYLIKKHDPCDGDFFPTKEEQNFHKKCLKNVYTDEMKEIIETLSSLERKIIDSFDSQLVNLKTEEVVDFTDFIERKTKNISKMMGLFNRQHYWLTNNHCKYIGHGYGPCPFQNNIVYLYKTTLLKDKVNIYEQRRDTYEYIFVKEITKDEFNEFFKIVE